MTDWSSAVGFCAAQNLALCPRAAYCPRGSRGDDNTNIGKIQPCTHGGPRSQTEIKAEDTRRGLRTIASVVPSLLRELMRDVVGMAAPSLPTHFRLIMPEAEETTEISVPTQKAIIALLKLMPHFVELTQIKEKMTKNKESSRSIQSAMDRIDILVEDDSTDIFTFDTTGFWEDDAATQLYKSVMPKMTAYAKAHGLKDEIDVIEMFDEWDDISSKFSEQDAESCCAKFKSMHAEKRRQYYLTDNPHEC